MIVLGINSFFEHPAAALVRDGEILFAVEDERLTRIKHGKKYTPYKTYIPYESIGAALRHTGIRTEDIDEIAYSYDRWEHLRSLWGCFTGARMSSLQEEWAAFWSASNIRAALKQDYELPHRYREVLGAGSFRHTRFREWNHHLSHAASAFFCSGFDDAMIVVADGSGEVACTTVYTGQGRRIVKIASLGLPHSLGFFYSFITAHLGFEAFSDEYKVMGLAAYGEATLLPKLRQLVVRGGGGYRVRLDAVRHLERLLGPPRLPGEPITDLHRDIAKSAQALLEETLEYLILHHLRRTGKRRLCSAGGVFLNCVANGRIASLPGVDEYFVQPAAHDAGTAIGAAALSCVRHGEPLRFGNASMFLGTEYGDAHIVEALEDARLAYSRVETADAPATLGRLLAQEKVVALFRGRMEFGPRALGGRSLLASPLSSMTRDKLNVIKGREEFRPLAPLVTAEAYHRYFEGPPNRYMMLAVKARKAAFLQAPAVVHADWTSRVQVVRESEDPFLHATLRSFESMTGVPIIANTSLNVRGKPIDESPEDALCSFVTTGIDAMLIGNYLVER